MSGRDRWLATSALLLLTGCPVQYESTQGQLTFEDDDLVAGPTGFDATGAVLAGTRLCPTIACADGCTVDQCFTPSVVSGDAAVDADCLSTGGAGDVDWAFTATAGCDKPGKVDDDVVVHVLAPADASPTVSHWIEDGAAEGSLVPESGASWPTDWLPAAGEPLYVVAGKPVPLLADLTDADGLHVAWAPAATSWTLEPSTAGTATASSRGEVLVTLGSGATAHVWMHVLASDGTTADYDLGEVDAVDESALADVSVVVGYIPNGDDPAVRTPLGARAVVHDTAGHAVFGVPFTWEATAGTLGLTSAPVGYGLGGDYAELDAGCLKPSLQAGDHTATLQATAGSLVATADLTWRQAASTSVDDGWVPPDDCTPDTGTNKPGCKCDSAPSAAGALPLLGLVATLLRRRR